VKGLIEEDIMAGDGRGSGHSLLTWLAVWCQLGLSSITITLYIILLDIAPPNVKPRPLLENVGAGFTYASHAANIIAALLLAWALLEQIDGVMVVWMLWSILYIVIQFVLIFLIWNSIFDHFTARIFLVFVALLLGIFSVIIILRAFRSRNDDSFHQYSSGYHGQQFQEKSKPTQGVESGML